MRRDGRGFSLIELLVVLAIVSLLVGVLLPALAGARRTAVRVQCQANLRSVHQTFHAYAADHADQVPLGYRGGMMQWNTMVYSGFSGIFVLFGRLYPAGYMTNAEAFYCPAETSDDQQFNTASNPWPPGPDGDPARNVQGGYASRPILDWGADELPLQMPRLSDWHRQAVFADTPGLPERINTRHRDGVHVLYGDSAVRWIDRPHFNPPLSTISDLSPMHNSAVNEIWTTFDDQR